MVHGFVPHWWPCWWLAAKIMLHIAIYIVNDNMRNTTESASSLLKYKMAVIKFWKPSFFTWCTRLLILSCWDRATIGWLNMLYNWIWCATEYGVQLNMFDNWSFPETYTCWSNEFIVYSLIKHSTCINELPAEKMSLWSIFQIFQKKKFFIWSLKKNFRFSLTGTGRPSI